MCAHSCVVTYVTSPPNVRAPCLHPQEGSRCSTPPPCASPSTRSGWRVSRSGSTRVLAFRASRRPRSPAGLPVHRSAVRPVIYDGCLCAALGANCCTRQPGGGARRSSRSNGFHCGPMSGLSEYGAVVQGGRPERSACSAPPGRATPLGFPRRDPWIGTSTTLRESVWQWHKSSERRTSG